MMVNALQTQESHTRLLVHSDRSELFLERVRREFPTIEVFVCNSYSGVKDSLRYAQPQIVLSHKFESACYPGEIIASAESVRWIHCGGTGFDHFEPWDPLRLTITNSPGLAAKAMSEYVLCAIYALNLRLPLFLRQQFRHEWARGSIRQSEGGTVAVIGLGRIGRAICARARAAGLKVLGVRLGEGHVKETDRTYAAYDLHAALASADHVVLIVPLTSQTTKLIDSAAIRAMKPGATLVNLSRGGVVDEAALLAAIHTGQVGGAAMDVFRDEPLPPESPFWDLENVIVTPHTAGFVDGWESTVRDLFCDNLARWLNGLPLKEVVKPETHLSKSPQSILQM